MHNLQTAADTSRRIGLLALLGFAVVTLSGPILAVLSVLLSAAVVVLGFAVVGLLVYVPLRVLFSGTEPALESIRSLVRTLGGTFVYLLHLCIRVLAFVPRGLDRVRAGVVSVVRFVLRTAWKTVRFGSEIGVVALSGVLVGAALGAVSGMVVPVCAIAGGLIAGVVGTTMTVLERRPFLSHPVSVRS